MIVNMVFGTKEVLWTALLVCIVLPKQSKDLLCFY